MPTYLISFLKALAAAIGIELIVQRIFNKKLEKSRPHWADQEVEAMRREEHPALVFNTIQKEDRNDA